MNKLVRDVMAETVRQARELSRIAEAIPHDGLRWQFRESFLARALRLWLPRGVELGTGVIVDENGTQREVNEDDIIIYAPDLLPPALPLIERNIFLLDAVLARIEVKSTLSSDELEAAVKGAIAVRNLKTSYEGKREIHAVFAYKSSAAVRSELVRLEQQVAKFGWSEPNPPLSFICVDEKECYMHGQIGNSPRTWFKLVPDAPDESTLAFISSIASSVNDTRSSRKSVQIARFVYDTGKAEPMR